MEWYMVQRGGKRNRKELMRGERVNRQVFRSLQLKLFVARYVCLAALFRNIRGAFVGFGQSKDMEGRSR